LNVKALGAGLFEVESESSPGKYYKVEYNSKQAASFGVDYSCPCKSWINNVEGDRTCKHTRAVEGYRNTIINQVSSKQRIKVAKGIVKRRRGRPSYHEVEYCNYCFKSSVRLKEEGFCKYCGKARGENKKEYAPKIKPINDETVSLEKESLMKAAESLGF